MRTSFHNTFIRCGLQVLCYLFFVVWLVIIFYTVVSSLYSFSSVYFSCIWKNYMSNIEELHSNKCSASCNVGKGLLALSGNKRKQNWDLKKMPLFSKVRFESFLGISSYCKLTHGVCRHIKRKQSLKFWSDFVVLFFT